MWKFILPLVALILLTNAQTQCGEESLQLYNTELNSGYLPTYLFKTLLDSNPQNKYIPLAATVTGTGWTLTTVDFAVEVDVTSQVVTGVPSQTDNSGTITVTQPSINLLVYFNINNQTINIAQGVAVLQNYQGANYSFTLQAGGDDAYSYGFVSASIDFTGASFTYIYVNFPSTSIQQSTILNAINTQGTIQTALNTYFSDFPQQISDALSDFPILTENYPSYTFTYQSPSMGAQQYTFNTTLTYVLLQYTPYVGYFLSSTMDINGLTTPYTCTYPLTPASESQVQSGTAELISLDLLINSFNYGLQQQYYQTIINSKYWNVPYFSWITGGLNGIITSAYAAFPFQTPVTGSCSAVSGQFNQVNTPGKTSNTMEFAIEFDCTLTAQETQLAAFQINFSQLQVGILFNQDTLKSYLSFQIVNGNYTIGSINPAYPAASYNTDLLSWYVNQTIIDDFYGSVYLNNVIPTQYRAKPTYTFTSLGLLIQNDES